MPAYGNIQGLYRWETFVANLPELRGSFDGFRDGRHFGGWVTTGLAYGMHEIQIFVTLKEREIGRAVADRNRADGFRGFYLQSDMDVSNEDVVREEVKVWAQEGECPPIRLSLYHVLRERICDQIIGEMTTLRSPHGSKRSESVPSKEALHGIEVVPAVHTPPTVVRDRHDTSEIRVRVGTVCSDRSAIIGRNGYLFIYGGNNDLYSLYRLASDDPYVIELARKWIALFELRDRNIKSLGLAFIQLVIPDKSSLYPELFPETIAGPTPLLGKIEESWKGESYLSIIGALLEAKSSGSCFSRPDLHLSDYGCCVASCALLKRLAHARGDVAGKVYSLVEQFNEIGFFSGERVSSGDLGRRFFGVPLFETIATVSSVLARNLDASAQLCEDFTPATGHSGTRRVWVNPSAPVNLKVVAFANSFFERGGAPSGLSWWCKVIFSEFHFVWSANLDYEYVASIKPDLVICQTVERFLRFPPTS